MSVFRMTEVGRCYHVIRHLFSHCFNIFLVTVLAVTAVKTVRFYLLDYLCLFVFQFLRHEHGEIPLRFLSDIEMLDGCKSESLDQLELLNAFI